jgi:hypothetical protein
MDRLSKHPSPLILRQLHQLPGKQKKDEHGNERDREKSKHIRLWILTSGK